MVQGTVVIDACLAITFGNVDALAIVSGLRLHRVVIAERAAGEVTRPPASTALSHEIGRGTIIVETIDISDAGEQGALARFDAMPAFRNRGDAQVLALATARGYLVGSDDDAVRRVAFAELGVARLAGTLDFLKWAVVEGRIATSEALTLLPTLDVGLNIMRRLALRGRTLEQELAN